MLILTDGQTNRQTHQKYCSEPHKITKKKKNYKKKQLFTDRQTDGRTTQNYSSEPHKKSFHFF